MDPFQQESHRKISEFQVVVVVAFLPFGPAAASGNLITETGQSLSWLLLSSILSPNSGFAPFTGHLGIGSRDFLFWSWLNGKLQTPGGWFPVVKCYSYLTFFKETGVSIPPPGYSWITPWGVCHIQIVHMSSNTMSR